MGRNILYGHPMVDRIRTLLARRGAVLGHVRSMEPTETCQRVKLARAIAKRYRTFDVVRHILGAGNGDWEIEALPEGSEEILQGLVEAGFASETDQGYVISQQQDHTRFLTGGWLEELAYHAILEAGADTALVGQKLLWEVQQYRGSSEIDVIARKGDRMLFVSCKSVKSELGPVETAPGRNQRKQLMEYLHETDNLTDHFGMPGDVAALVVTTDLIDESAGFKARYSALFGKALRLDVELITLEDVRWANLVARFRRVFDGMGAH